MPSPIAISGPQLWSPKTWPPFYQPCAKRCRIAPGRHEAEQSRSSTESKHQLLTPKEQAFVKFGIRPGVKVRFP
jgi:hypothetical protein